jgi:hypothetical protein
MLLLAIPAKATPKHFYRDWRWWTGAAVIVGTELVDVHSSCRVFAEGYHEMNWPLRGTRSCGKVASSAMGFAAIGITLHALAWHCVQNDGWFGKCYGMNQDNGKYKRFWDDAAYLAAPAAFGIPHTWAAIDNYRLPRIRAR